MAYTKHFVVRWSECDANGHLRNTAYSEYGIETRMSFLSEQGFPYARFVEHAIGPVIQREEIDYLHELHLGDGVEVDFRGMGMSRDGARFKLRHEFFRPGGRLVARIVIAGGWMDLRRRKLTSPPEDLVRTLASLERVEPYEELADAKKREG
jgi:acyl-CoA thioester hydrolase